jgi:hypothetical protein
MSKILVQGNYNIEDAHIADAVTELIERKAAPVTEASLT